MTRRRKAIKLYFSPGMNATEIVWWNVDIGHITRKQARQYLTPVRANKTVQNEKEAHDATD